MKQNLGITECGSDFSAVCIRATRMYYVTYYSTTPSKTVQYSQTFGAFSASARATNLVHFVHVRRIAVKLYEDRNLLASAPPRHDTLGGERRGAGDAGEGYLLSTEVAVEHLAAADRRRPLYGGVRRGWPPVVVVVARCS